MLAVEHALLDAGFPVKTRDRLDANKSLDILVRKVLCDMAEGESDTKCVAALCATESLGCSHALVWPNVVYLYWEVDGPLQKGSDGQNAILRYKPSQALVRKVLLPLDLGHPEDIVLDSYTLKAPAKAQRLGVNRSRKGPERPAHKSHRPHRPMGRQGWFVNSKFLKDVAA